MKDLLKMGKNSLVKYNIFEGEESRVYWEEDSNGNKIITERKDLKTEKNYFKGKMKKSGDDTIFFYEAMIKVIWGNIILINIFINMDGD